MIRTISVSILSLILLCLTGCREHGKPEIPEAFKSGLRQDAKDFMESLKSVLIKEIQTNGIVSAASVCSDTAQLLTNSYGITKGIYIKRVSFRNRNPFNRPDESETRGLKYFEELFSAGRLDENTEFIDMIEKDGVKTLLFMKPIVIQAPCLNCHGQQENIIPEVRKIIDRKYPEDKALNYKTGDLRGAVSIQKVL